MKKALALFAVVLAVGMTTVLDAEAKRLGGGKSSGMQRQSVTAPATPPAGTSGLQSTPSQAVPGGAAAAAGTAAAAPRRSWMGPIAGIAAGLGIAALASHFGFGEALANMMTIALVVMAVLLLVGFVLRKRAAAQGPAMAGAGAPSGMLRTGMGTGPATGSGLGTPASGSRIGSALGAGTAAVTPSAIPADFDVPAFVRNAKSQFMALQAANDARDLARLRDVLTPEMFDEVRAEIDARPAGTQATEVFGLEAQVLEVVQEDSRYVVSVRFTGSVREQPGAVPEDLDEVWHLTKPRWGNGGWVIAGIQQSAPQ
jgi:predicted lipid-binding transport protein (Tim44 family)